MSMGQADGSRTVVERAYALTELGRRREAMELLQPHLAAHCDDVEGWCVFARCEMELDEFDSALAHADAALRLDPEEPAAWWLRTMTLILLRRHDEALAAAAECRRLDPDSWLSHTTYAYALSHFPSRLAEAFEAACNGVAVSPLEPQAHLAVGLIAAGQGRRRVAERAYRRVLELDPQDADARNGMGTLQMSGWRPGRVQRAAPHYAGALSVDPNHRLARENIDALTVLLLRRARRWALASCVIALVVAGFGIGVGAAEPVSAPIRFLVLAAIVVGWVGGSWYTIRRLPAQMSASMRRLPTAAGRLPALGIAVMMLGTVAALAIPWRTVAAPIVLLVMTYGAWEVTKPGIHRVSGRDVRGG
jgi:cytochrome c-type biogenesis protein CcmH/NrfG